MQYLAGVRLAARISSAPLIRRTQFVRAYAAISNSKPPKQPTGAAPIELLIDNGILNVGRGKFKVQVPGRWLRDQCACAECRNPQTAQRQINVFKNPDAGKIVDVKRVSSEVPDVEVTFKDGHRSVVSVQQIRNKFHMRNSRYGSVDIARWRAEISENPPEVRFDSMQQGDGMANLLTNIRKYGFCFIDNMPATPEASQALLEDIGPIRNTHYGGFYDFTSDLSSKDTAYTSESLEPHTDTTYFTDPIGLQALHLLSHTDGEGGLSSLVDGFAASAHIYKEDNAAYLTLCHTPVFAHASGNEGVSIQPADGFPVLNTSQEHKNGPFQIRWNNADRAGVRASLGPDMDRWYDAAAKFDAFVNDPKNQYWFQLKPGRMLLFDNWRVLHGRSAFTGKRRMCGGYINRDDFISKYRMTNISKKEIEASTVTG